MLLLHVLLTLALGICCALLTCVSLNSCFQLRLCKSCLSRS